MVRIWPVIHFHTPTAARRNAQMAVEAGAHGVFLIHMEGQDDLLDPVGESLMRDHPTLCIGVNYLSLAAPSALARALAIGYGACWTDRPGVRSDGVSDGARRMAEVLAARPDHTFFASVAFKYQPADPDPGEAARRALELGMLPTTSGDATGHAPDPAKLERIRAIIGPPSAHAPLALASGVSPENAAALAPHLTDVLVSTGVSSDFHTFAPDRLARLVAVLRGKPEQIHPG